MRLFIEYARFLAGSAIALVLAFPGSGAQAGDFRLLYTFLGGSDGQNPAGPLLRDHAGNLFGTTSAGGGANACSGGCGTAFRLAPDGTETVLHAFDGGSDGSSPVSGVIADKAGNLYGTTQSGGGNACWNGTCGTVFKIAPDGSETVLYAFKGASDGANPGAGLIADRKGNLYGTTQNGGNTTNNYYGCGTVFRLTPGGSFRVLYTFAGGFDDGCTPMDSLIRDAAGNFYGTTNTGDGAQNGVIFRLAPDGTETLLYELSGGVGGGFPRAGLLMDGSGNLYGTSSSGDEYLYGAVFKLAPNGTLTSLYAFSGGRNGASPDGGVIMDTAGDLYGTTDQGGADGGGTVFRLTTDGKHSIPHNFTGGNDGTKPDNTLIIDDKGNLYGTAVEGGSKTCSYGCGTVFKILANPPSHIQGAVIISSTSTQNMNCSGGTCQPTAKNAVLNAGDLQTMLASGSVEVTTTGSGVQADDIEVEAPIGWSTASTLALEAKNTIAIDSPILVRNGGGLTFVTGGAETNLSFAKKGHVRFKSLNSNLVINGVSYVLANTLPTLAADVAANEYGFFALANSYDASHDGTYDTAPISEMGGSLEGLGNVISNLTVAETQNVFSGLIGTSGGTINNLGLANANISGSGNAGSTAGAIIGWNIGILSNSYATGEISGSDEIGGLVGEIYGTVSHCTSSVTVSGGKDDGGLAGVSSGNVEYSSASGQVSGTVSVGGLVGDAQGGTYKQSFASGSVTGANNASVGGLMGTLVGSSIIKSSYATSAVTGGQNANVGGLVGDNYYGSIVASYSTGAVTGQAGSYLGGLIGYDQSSPRELINAYWDTTSSGITNLGQGAGNVSNDPGIAGLSSTQLQSGRPQGFVRRIWREKSNTNNGFPYLIANPPSK